MSNTCINIHHPSVVELSKSLNTPKIIIGATISLWQEANNTDKFPSKEELLPYLNKDNEVQFTLKAIEILQSDKAKQVFEKGVKSKWTLDKILSELQIPKEQAILFKDVYMNALNKGRVGLISQSELLDEVILDFVNKYSYTIEINTTKTKQKNIDDDFIEQHEFIESGERPWNQEKENPTQYYSNLTAPGGTNYTENELATPLITPSIKGHAQFSTDNGIGWFRSDDKDITYTEKVQLNEIFDAEYHNYENHRALVDKEESITKQEYEEAKRKGKKLSKNIYEYNNYIYEYQDVVIDEFYFKKKIPITLPDANIKTRRILEIQSDLYQKGRNLGDIEQIIKDLQKSGDLKIDCN